MSRSANGGGGPLAEVVAAAEPALREWAVGDPGAGRFAREVADPDRAVALEAAYEAYLLHFGDSRAFAGLDADLALLAGDTLYALGLARLAARGDLEAVAELSDLIALCARVQADGRPELAEPLWEASAAALSGGGAGARAAFERLAPEG